MRRVPAWVLIVAAWTILCAALGARSFVDLDAIQLGLALEHQDLRLHQPQPPGFVVHVWLAQVLHAFGATPFVALRLVSWLGLAAAAFFLYRSALMLYERKKALWSLILFVSSPLVLFHGMSVGTFGNEAFVASLMTFLCLRAWTQQRRGLRVEAYWAGLLGGLRPTTLLFTLPMLIWTGHRLRSSWPQRAAASLAWCLGTLCWLIPQADLAGGLNDYAAANWALLEPILRTAPLFTGPVAWMEDLGMPLTTGIIGLGAWRLLATLAVAPPRTGGLERGFILVWALPVLLWGLLLGFRDPGALLALWPLCCLVLASGWLAATPWARWRATLLVAAIAVDVASFLWLPTPSTTPASRPLATVGVTQSMAPPVEPATVGWKRLPTLLQRAGSTLLARVSFFHDRTRHADFDPFLEAISRSPFPPDETLLIGSVWTRAACLRLPDRSIVQAEPSRPSPYLHYRERRPTVIDSSYVVPPGVAWILLEGEPSQLLFAPPTAETESPIRALRLTRDLQAFAIGRQRVDAWFTPTAREGGEAPHRFHLWREALLDDPEVFERAAADLRRRP